MEYIPVTCGLVYALPPMQAHHVSICDIQSRHTPPNRNMPCDTLSMAKHSQFSRGIIKKMTLERIFYRMQPYHKYFTVPIQ